MKIRSMSNFQTKKLAACLSLHATKSAINRLCLFYPVHLYEHGVLLGFHSQLVRVEHKLVSRLWRLLKFISDAADLIGFSSKTQVNFSTGASLPSFLGTCLAEQLQQWASGHCLPVQLSTAVVQKNCNPEKNCGIEKFLKLQPFSGEF